MRILLLSLIFLSGLSHSQDLQDVIYKKDGSVLRGVLIEQDFNSGRYKIQLNGGSVFSIEKADIEKITKEAPLKGAANNGAININIENNPNINQNPNTEVHASAIANNAPVQDTKFNNVFFIGSLMHTVTESVTGLYKGNFRSDLEKQYKYTGIKLGFQQIFNEHFASHYILNKGSLSTIELVDSDNETLESASPSLDEDYLGISASALLSSNLQKGWQFFTGLGIFHDTYSSDLGDNSIDGALIDLGMGYSWKPAQLQIHYQARISDDYPDDVSASNVNLQLGFNF